MKHELSSMKAFVILAESSSFNNAAKLLNITQPALTRRIKKMEEDLHIQLFERTTRKVTLTKAGKRLLPEARELIKKFDAKKIGEEFVPPIDRQSAIPSRIGQSDISVALMIQQTGIFHTL